ncbi:MAG: hypothetical protein ACI4HH_08295 [Hominenteromicrobium mulieris]
MKVYKGTDKNMQCQGKQYVLGRKEVDDGAIRCGGKGYHSCETPFDVLRHYPNINGNRFFEAEAGGEIDKAKNDDTKLASSELTLKSEIDFAGLVKAQIEYTRKKAESGTTGGDESNLAGGDDSNLAGGNRSNLAGGDDSNLAGGNRSNLAGGNDSNLAGGSWSNLAGGDWSNLAGGNSSLIIGRNECNAKGGLHSVIVLTEWKYDDNGNYVPIAVKSEIVDGVRIKADTWYKLENGEFVEVDG